MSNFRVIAIPTETAEQIRASGKSPGYGHPAHREVASGHGPCRHCLRTFHVGRENRILFTYDSFSGFEPIPLPGPVVIHEAACVRYREDAGYPADLNSYPVVLNAFAKGQTLIEKQLVGAGDDKTAAIENLLCRSGIDYIEVRDQTAGCFDFRIERAMEADKSSLKSRIGSIEWPRVTDELNAQGSAVVPALLSGPECAELASQYDQDLAFRSTVVMARHGFGSGEYKYFSDPLPPMVAELRTWLYPRLAPVANEWNRRLNIDLRYPSDHAEFLERCHAAGQTRPTPLLLRYRQGDYNCLHQDLYGEHVFPLQVAILLSEPGDDFQGGEFVLTEQRPRLQSRAEVVPLRQGDAVVFAVHHRPVQGNRGVYRVNLRHGVSRVRSGRRHTLGIIFHDAA